MLLRGTAQGSKATWEALNCPGSPFREPWGSSSDKAVPYTPMGKPADRPQQRKQEWRERKQAVPGQLCAPTRPTPTMFQETKFGHGLLTQMEKFPAQFPPRVVCQAPPATTSEPQDISGRPLSGSQEVTLHRELVRRLLICPQNRRADSLESQYTPLDLVIKQDLISLSAQRRAQVGGSSALPALP